MYRVKNNSGMTIMEILIAMAIGIIMLTAIASLLVAAVKLDAVTKARREASELAERKVEELRRQSFGALSSGADTVGNYTREWVITIPTGETRIKEIAATVNWEDSKGRTHSIVYNTTIYRNAYPYK